MGKCKFDFEAYKQEAKRGFAGENQPEAKKAYFNLC